MDADLEDELMDLATNERAYLPQAAHSRTPTEVSNLNCTSSLRGSTRSTPRTLLPVSLGEPFGKRTGPILAAPCLNSLTTPRSSSVAGENALAECETVASTEEPLGWYEQIEMVLAAAEAKYYEWLDDIDSQGSITEEEHRRADMERVARRGGTIAQLKAERRATVQAMVDESNRGGSLDPNLQDGVVDVDKMMDKLAFIVDESAKQVQAQRLQAVWTRLAEDLPQTERDYVARGADEMFREKLKYKRDPEETRHIVEQHVNDMLKLQVPTRNGQSVGRTMNHSLGLLLREFVDIFHFCYGGDTVKTAVAQGMIGAELILPLLAADVNHFASILVQILHYKFPELPRSWSPLVHRCVIGALFDHLQPTLHVLYAAAFDGENKYVNCHAQSLRLRRLKSFGVAKVFRLDGTWQPMESFDSRLCDTNESMIQSLRQYEPLICRMNELPTHRSPWIKAEVIADISKSIDHLVKDYYARRVIDGHQTPTESEINMTADDLAALLAFLIVASPAVCNHLPTQLALLGSFMASESAMGEEGFAIATFWTAVNHVCYLA